MEIKEILNNNTIEIVNSNKIYKPTKFRNQFFSTLDEYINVKIDEIKNDEMKKDLNDLIFIYNTPGIYMKELSKATHYFDGLPKIIKFHIKNGKIYFT